MAKRRKPVKDDPRWSSDLKPAPGELRILQAFVNTADRRGTEELSSPEALAAWLVHWDLLSTNVELTDADLEQAISTREALRALIAADHGRRLHPSTVERLDAVAARSPVCVRFGKGGASRFEPADDDFAGALGRLFAIVAEARSDGLWTRLKICANGECRRAFYDASRSRSGRWCRKERCGNLVHSRAFRKRHPNYYRYS